VYPRLSPIPQYVELTDFIADNRLLLRVDYGGYFEADCIPFHLFEPLELTPLPLGLVKACHSRRGEIPGPALEENGPGVVIEEGEYLDLVFRGRPPKNGYRQMLLLAATGRYDKAETVAGSEDNIVFSQNYPNPFNPNTNFSFYLPRAMPVSLRIYNVLGQTVRVLVEGHREAGAHTVLWDSRNDAGETVASGVYFAWFTAGQYSATKKVEVLK